MYPALSVFKYTLSANKYDREGLQVDLLSKHWDKHDILVAACQARFVLVRLPRSDWKVN
jgi:hypothetical protein